MGEIIHLGEGEPGSLAIFTKAQTKKANGAVILLHDLGAHADWPDVIAPLRRQLPISGWHTQSVQMPVVESEISAQVFESLETETLKRLRAAIAYCRDQRIYNLVLLGHGYGAVVSALYITTTAQNQHNINAIVGISPYSPSAEKHNRKSSALYAKIALPVLDIVGANETAVALESASLRQTAAKREGQKKYKQIRITGADYTFNNVETTLATRILGWIKNQAPSMEIKIPSANTPSQQ